MFGNWPKLTFGTVNGFPLRLDATFAIVPLLFLNRFSMQSSSEDWLEIGVVIIGVFLSVLLHELGHALTARRFGVGVQEVVVGGFYGYARLMPHRTTRRAAIAIIAAGPGANLLIFLVLWAILSFPSLIEMRTIAFLGYPETIGPVWLAKAAGLLVLANLLMFIFNLVPAFPLDGGRIVDQVLSRFVPPHIGIQISVLLGIAIGAIFAVIGLGFSLFLSLIGVFVIVVNVSRLRSRPPARPQPRRPAQSK